jgi:peptidyl-prolyl cis-trans isomerase C
LADVRAGADFEKIAREQSADPGSAPKGGDLGYFTQGKMVPEFQAAVDALKNPGDLSPVVRTAFGFHIIRLEDRKPGRLQSFDEVKDQLRAETIAKLKNDARKKEVERVRALGQGDAAALEAFIAEQKALAEKTAGKADQPPSAGKP